ncbi:polysialyltransferase family glycosyltransferase [Cellulophaga fucicola]|uniref:Uncharacterized protein n=1 Tax=Cellulophaga fucicola TaxID=76595 RepID=A0A1K1QAB2_9FLAO|nr:polysialyltransferase family glycosyltransferase [Cellulophaga fucicola]SFW56595.1 hypothetical protein SAMN05660313_02497 [Cellulophaga fucicola]
MKYLFHIHSNINLLVAIGIVEKCNYRKEDVFFLLNRGIKTSFLVNTIDIPENIYYHPFNTIKKLKNLNFLKNKAILAEIDSIIKSATLGGEFIYFCANSRVPFYRAFFSHKKCSEVHYIEDGMDAYLPAKELESKYPKKIPKHLLVIDFFLKFLPWFCSNRLRYLNIDFMGNFKNKKSVVYCINKKAYDNQSNNNKVVLNIDEISFFNKQNLKNDVLFVFDAVVEQKVIKEEDLNKFVDWFSEIYFKGKNISIKFHPFQSKLTQQQIVKKIEANGTHVEVISNDIIMEVLFVKKKQLIIYGIGSSLLVYGSMINNHKVKVLYPYFEKQLGVLSPRLNTWNTMFLNNDRVELLEKI